MFHGQNTFRFNRFRALSIFTRQIGASHLWLSDVSVGPTRGSDSKYTFQSIPCTLTDSVHLQRLHISQLPVDTYHSLCEVRDPGPLVDCFYNVCHEWVGRLKCRASENTAGFGGLTLAKDAFKLSKNWSAEEWDQFHRELEHRYLLTNSNEGQEV